MRSTGSRQQQCTPLKLRLQLPHSLSDLPRREPLLCDPTCQECSLSKSCHWTSLPLQLFKEDLFFLIFISPGFGSVPGTQQGVNKCMQNSSNLNQLYFVI